ncbi:lysine N(6)-hydroxylase/L-ornithine N(5)-oxygenase family protein [Streptacidiphilus monticola]
MHDVIYDLVGVGIGPFNLSLAALADGVPGLRTLFLDGKPEFDWHPGMMLDDARLQVPFLADLVSLVDPTSRWSFLAYLRERGRLFPFYFAEQWHPTRREYQDYCRWAASGLASCRFGQRVTEVEYAAATGLFTVTTQGGMRARTRNVVLGVGTEPVVPPAFAAVRAAAVWHSEDYLSVVDKLCRETDVTVVGSGQSGAEVVLDLLRRRGPEREPHLRWVTRTQALAPMEYSRLGLEHFTPDYTRYFHGLPEAERDRLVPSQWQLYKAASAETLGELHEALYQRTVAGLPADLDIRPGTEVVRAAPGLELTVRHRATGVEEQLHTGAVVLATGYAARRPACLEPSRS